MEPNEETSDHPTESTSEPELGTPEHECPPSGPHEVGDEFHCEYHGTDYRVTHTMELGGEVFPVWSLIVEEEV